MTPKIDRQHEGEAGGRCIASRWLTLYTVERFAPRADMTIPPGSTSRSSYSELANRRTGSSARSSSPMAGVNSIVHARVQRQAVHLFLIDHLHGLPDDLASLGGIRLTPLTLEQRVERGIVGRRRSSTDSWGATSRGTSPRRPRSPWRCDSWCSHRRAVGWRDRRTRTAWR